MLKIGVRPAQGLDIFKRPLVLVQYNVAPHVCRLVPRGNKKGNVYSLMNHAFFGI